MEWVLLLLGIILIGFFSAGCPCCGCTVASDDFNRTAGTSLGSDWTEESGSWEIVSGGDNFLRTSSSSAIAVYSTEITETDYAVEVKVEALPDLDPVRIYIRQDSSNYLAFEHQNDAPFSGINDNYLRIIECVSGTETEVVKVHFSTRLTYPTHLRVCVYSAGYVGFGYTSSGLDSSGFPGAIAYLVPPGGEIAIGTGTGISGNVDLDDFKVYRRSEDCAACKRCCGDVDEYPPEEVQIELADMGTAGGGCADCASLDGTYTLTIQGLGVPVVNATGFVFTHCYYRLVLDESICGAKYMDFWLGDIPAVGLERAFNLSIGNANSWPVTPGAGGKVVYFRSTEGVGTEDFCTLVGMGSVVLAETVLSDSTKELCRTTGARPATATVTPL